MNNTQKRSMITGYAGLPFGEISQCEAGNIGVLGVPSEVDSGPRMGASLAPDALRKMSQQLGIDLPVNGRDLGIWILSGDWSGALNAACDANGGVTLCQLFWVARQMLLRACCEALPDLPVVAAMPLARGDVAARQEETIWVGLNGGQPADVWDQISQRSMAWRTARQLDEGHTGFSSMPKRAILWVDISVIDLGHAAGAVGLNPGGMKPETLVSVIEAMTCSWQAIVITGLAPARDTRGMSELVAIETLNAALRNG